MSESPLAIIRRYMTPHQARCSTLGMNAREIANLAGVLERLDDSKREQFVIDMSSGVDDLVPTPEPKVEA